MLPCARRNKFTTANPAIEFLGDPDLSVVELYDADELVLAEVNTPDIGAGASNSTVVSWHTAGMSSPAAERCTGPSVAGRSFIGVRVPGDSSPDVVRYYVHDPRLRLIQNTIDAPATDSRSTAGTGACPAVTKNFVNARGCARSTDTCSPLAIDSEAEVTLDHDIRRAWYTTSGRYVYMVVGLRLETDAGPAAVVPPCTRGFTSRWIRAPGLCPPTIDTNLDDRTIRVVRKAIDAVKANRNGIYATSGKKNGDC